MSEQQQFTQIRDLRREIVTVLRKVDHFLKENDTGPRDLPSVERIQRVVANFYRYRIHELKSVRRDADLVFARHMAMYLCKELTNRSYPAIARTFGHRDHTTVMHGFRKIDRLIREDAHVAQDASLLLLKIARERA